MKANKFVKKFGWDGVISQLNKTQDNVVVIWLGSQSNDYALVKDLKRLVESHELIGGDLEYAKKFYADCAFKRDKHLVRYKQAIADVESCQ